MDGASAGRFAVIDPDVTADALLGAVVQWMRTRLEEGTSAEQQPVQLRLALHLVGVPADEIEPLIDRLPASRA